MIKLSSDIQLGDLIENHFGDHYLFSVNRKIIEQMDYQTLFNKEFNKTFDQKDTLYVIAGTDSGLMVKQLLNTPPKKGSTYLFIDFPEIIALTQAQYDLEEQKRIIVTTEDKWQEEAKKIGMGTYFWINKVKQIKSFATQYYYLNEYLFLWKSIEDNIKHLAWQNQSQIGNSIFVQRQLENLAEHHSPAIILKDNFKGKSALILAGGPSLDKYIDWIEENQQHYIVIAVTRIARRLLQTQIKPDIFVSVDPHPYNFEVSKEVFHFEQDSLLINQYHLTPMLLGNWQGVNLYLGNLFPWTTKQNIDNLTGIGPTVTNSAILLAIQMGIKQQILFGVDLCYSSEGYSHASSSKEHNQGPDINLVGQTVETNKGEKAETVSAYYEAITSIEYLAQLAKNSGGELINPSPDSAKMANVQHILISDIIIPKEQINISEFLQKQSQKIEQPKYRISHFERVIKELKKAQVKIEKIKKLADKGLEYNNKFFAADNPEKNFNFKIKMDKLEKELNQKDLVDFTTLSKKFGIQEFLYFLNPDNDREWTNEEIKKSGDTYYKALKSGSNELARHIFTAINRTETRMLEQGQLKVSNETIKRHLCSFKKNRLLDSINNKQEVISNINSLMTAYHNDNNFPGETSKQKILAVSFFMVMLQNGVNLQTRRLRIFAKGNSELFNLSDNTIILDKPTINIDILGRTVKDIKEAHKKIYHSWFSPDPANNANSNTSKLEGLETKLYNLFILKDVKSIEKIIKGINLIDSKYPEREAYLHLAQGYHYELLSEVERAIDEYGFADSPRTTESALKRLALIALDRKELGLAHNVLKVLSDVSTDYLPQLAELYVLTKNYKDALDTYMNYLNYNSSDISVLFKVGKLYESQHILDGAQFIYKEILKLEPENQIAKTSLNKLASFSDT